MRRVQVAHWVSPTESRLQVMSMEPFMNEPRVVDSCDWMRHGAFGVLRILGAGVERKTRSTCLGYNPGLDV